MTSASERTTAAEVLPTPGKATSTPAWSFSFDEVNIKSSLGDGYWIEAFPFRSKVDKGEGPVGPEVIGYGLGYEEDGKAVPSEVRMYLNPYHDMKNQIVPPDQWEYTVIQTLNQAVAATYGNFRPDSGLNDIIICHDYGQSMDNLNMNGGDVSLLVNPGDKKKPNWERRFIGKFPAMHRLKTGYFTQTEHVEIMALPIMIKSKDRESPAPVIIYTPMKYDDNKIPSEWKETRPLEDAFRLIHDVQIIHSTTGGLDQAVVAGREGISVMWKDEGSEQWKHENIGSGLPRSPKVFANPYWGSGSVATARVGDDSVGYIATCEAFHGNIVSVYVKPPGTGPGMTVPKEGWRRFVIDDFGPLKEANNEFTGTIHNVVCADLDGSGVDSIIVACMGYPLKSAANRGTYVYKPLDLQRGLFARSKISDASAGRIAVADFRCSGTWDVATISYSVPNYLESPDPAIRVLLNRVKQTRHIIKAQKDGDEVTLRVPRAASADHISEMPFLDIGGKKLSIVILPPHKAYRLGDSFTYQGKEYQKDGVKIINGELSWTSGGTLGKRGIAVERREAASMILDAEDNIVKAGEKGAIFIRLASSAATALPGLKFERMEDVATVNNLPFGVDPTVRDMVFPWVKCSDRKWGQESELGFNWPFYNLIGYHVVYDDRPTDKICHIQAWTLGIGETAAFHNHEYNHFFEIHACISNGTGQGGMWWAKNGDGNKYLGDHQKEMDPSKLEQYADKVVVNDMEEHGPLWSLDEDGRPIYLSNGAIGYPYHAWLAGRRTKPEDAGLFDVWLAFEFPLSEREFNKGTAH
ncbi:hypothetical protein FRC08_003912 [Ceratobasidium sp. 394]|nr:hypothetical protein FRC08_003912 [Ceratobasidium sp. 394]